MSLKHRLLSRKSRTVSVEDRALEDTLRQLGLESHRAEPLDLAAMLEINTWNLEDPPAQSPTDLPHAFLHRLWLLSPQARSTDCLTQADPSPEASGNGNSPGQGKDTHCSVNPLDLVTAVYMCASGFLRQELTVRMAQCGFAVPLLLPPCGQGGQVALLLWALRAVVRKWRPESLSEPGSFIEQDIASASMPLLSFIRLGRCSISKSQVLNHILGGLQRPTSCYLHRDMHGGQLPRKLSDGLVEVSWYLPSGDHDQDIFPEPVMVGNLRGDAAASAVAFKAQLLFLCRNSSALFVFCESLGTAERLQLASFRDGGCRILLVMCSQGEGEEGKEEEEEERKDTALKKLAGELELPEGAVFSCSTQDSTEALASALSEAAGRLLQDSPRPISLVEAAATANELSITTDEGEACRMALTQVEEVLEGLEQKGASRYMEEQLPLQGQLWKRLAQVEKEKHRLNDSVKSQREQEVKTEMESLCQQKKAYRRTAAMKSCIAALSTPDRLKRAFFLSWMRLSLNAMAWQRRPITEKQEEATTAEGTEEILRNSEKMNNQQMKAPEPFVGLTHFTREMGLIFEISISNTSTGIDGVQSFPTVATDLLLYGLPFELLDGDASTMPARWIGSVLSEVHERLPQGSRVRVLTVLGLHSSSNAAVISSLFGVTFPVGDMENVRGAYMLLLAVPDNLRKDLACNFLLLINTEGLKSLGLDQEEDAETHTNELATFAMGLSDVTLLNLPARGETEMRDTLRIMVNALLRVTEKGRAPFFQAVAQGNCVDTKQLLQLLSRVTQVLAAGDANLIESGLDDLREYEVVSSQHCLPGPWQNSHPMAPVSPEYSKAVMDHKQTLLTTLRKCAAYTPSISLRDFSEHVTSLWEAVLFEKFPFEMKNINVGEAFCDLCRELSHWEQTFLEYMGHWVEGAVELIRTFEQSTEVPNGHQNLDEFVSSLKIQAVKEVESEGTKVISNLEEYFKEDKGNSSLIEKYRDNFTNSVCMLKVHTVCEGTYKLDAAKTEHDIATITKHFQTELAAPLEERLVSILERYKGSEPIPEDKQLREEFDQVWDESVSKLDLSPLATRDITSQVLLQLWENLSNRGISKHLDKVTEMATYEASVFTIDEDHFGYRSRMKQMFTYEHKIQAQELADRVIEMCRRYVLRKMSLNRDHLDSYTRELLKIVDTALETKQFDIRSRFEVELKVHVCASAARAFQEMHENFTRESDPLTHIENARDQHFWNFAYDFRKRDQCQRVARTFTTVCLKPAVLDYIYHALGKLILEHMLSRDDGRRYRSPKAFQFNLLKELLQEDSFESFLEYLLSSESFIRGRIRDHINKFLSGTGMLQGWTQQSLELISERMATTARRIGGCCNESWRDVRQLLEEVCDDLEGSGDVAVPRDALRGPLFQISMPPGDRFVECLEESFAEMLQAVNQECLQAGSCQTENVVSKVQAFPIRPLDEVYVKVRGCEERCPFCKAPCEVWEVDHAVHRTLLHRPKGLVSYVRVASHSLSHTICPSEIVGGNQFCNRDTDGQFLHYRDYQLVYPNWKIPEEAPSTWGQSVYWRYVLARHNSRFAQEYHSESAQLPEEWSTITQAEAIQSLKETFGIF